jgi:hypothetical protein
MLMACYAPSIPSGAPCTDDSGCPSEHTCVITGGNGMCTPQHGGRPTDAGSDTAPPSDSALCLGGKLLGSVCLQAMPTGPVTLPATINTGATGANGCTEIHPQTNGPSLCIITGTTIDVPTATTVRAIGLIAPGSTAPNTNALVLVATQAITISGTIDVSSHYNEKFDTSMTLGAGARTVAGCLVVGGDGQGGTGNNGGGGGAGGSFGGAGAAGGTGGNNGGTARGNPASAGPPTVLTGGCPGGKGGEGAGTFPSGGAGGGAGGAVYLLAGDSITVAGKINASGAGGGPGGPGDNSSGGGGGGGAGGMIGLEGTRITVTGQLFANGGGGAGGGGKDGQNVAGKQGTDPTAPLTVAPGGSASNGGGAGGAGTAGTTAPVAGKNGSGNFPQCGGGGGGGGAGAIRVYGVPPASLGGTISPAASS